MAYLHMLYAGRGDAFIIEDASRFYLLDGGPLGFSSHTAGSAPYYRYLKSKLFQVSSALKPNQPISPDGVVVTHWHEDHYGGLARLFEEYLSLQPNDGKPLAFDGPLVAPKLSSSDLNHDARALLGPFTLQPGRPALAGMIFGGPDQILAYRKGAPTAQARLWDIDDSPLNVDSILLFHQASSMLFTGDSVGWKIQEFLGELNLPAAAPQLNIFKVPHHGSLRNSQAQQGDARLPDLAIADCRIYWLLAGSTDPSRPPDANGWLAREQVSDVVLLKKARALLLTMLGTDGSTELQTVTARLRTYLGQLDQAYPAAGNFYSDKIWSRLLTQIKASNSGFYTQMEVRLVKRPLWRRFNDPQLNPIAIRVLRVPHILTTAKPWTKELLDRDVACDFLLSRIAKLRLATFYNSFSAKAYVVSANSTYSHPAAETIAAIAQAASAARPLTLFVTDAGSVDLDAVDALAPQGWSQNLAIRYLNGVPSAKLDPTAASGAAMDVDGATAALDVTGRVDRRALHDLFEQGPQLVEQPGLGTHPAVKIKEASGLFLSIANGGAPQLVTQATPYDISDWWGGNPRISIADITLTDRMSGKSATFIFEPHDTTFALRWYAPGVNGATDYVRTGTNAIAYFTLQPVTTAALMSAIQPAHLAAMAGAASRPFRTFCADAQIPTNAPISASAALSFMTSAIALNELQQKLAEVAVEKAALGWPVAIDASSVVYETTPALSVSQASLSLSPPAGTKMTIGQSDYEIVGAGFDFAWTDTLTVTLSIQLKNGFGVTLNTQVQHVRVADYLIAMGLSEADANALPLGKVLDVMLGGRAAAESALFRLPAPLLRAGLPGWALDGRSSIETSTNPLGRIEVVAAILVPAIPGNTNLALTVEGLALTLGNVAVELTDARLVQQQLIFTATATPTRGPALKLSIDLSGDGEIELRLPDGATLGDLTAMLPGSPPLSSTRAPQAGPLSNLTLSAPIISLTQAGRGSNNLAIASVVLTARYDGWTSLLPATIAAPTASTVQVAIHRPLASDRTASLLIGFEFSAGNPGKPLYATLAVESLPGSSGATVTMEIASDPTRYVSLSDAVTALALSGSESSPVNDIPVLRSVLQSLYLDHARLSVDGGRISEFSLEVVVDGAFTIIPGLLTFEGATFSLGYFANGWGAEGNATLAVAGVNLDVSARLPRRDSPGFVAIDNPLGLKISDFLLALGAPDLSGLPVVGNLLSIAIVGADIVFGYGDEPNSPLSILQSSVVATLGRQSLGPLVVENIAIGVTYDKASGASFWLQGDIGSGIATVVVSYDASKKILGGIVSVTSTATLGDLLATVLTGDLLNTLRATIGGLRIAHSAIEFDCSFDVSPRLSLFDLTITTGTSIGIGAFSVTGLSYRFEMPPGSGSILISRLSGAVSVDLDNLAAGQEDLSGVKYILGRSSGVKLNIKVTTDIAQRGTLIANARFDASIDGDFTLVDAIHVTGPSLTYRPQGNPKLVIAVAGAWISIPLSQGRQLTPKFKGSITYGKVPNPDDPAKTLDGASALLELQDAEPQNGYGDFLGIPHVTLKKLKLATVWSYDPTRKFSTAAVQGEIAIGTSATLSAAMRFDNGKITSVVIKLAAAINLADVFAACLGLSDWGASVLPAVTLSDGQLTYALQPDTATKQYGASCKLDLLGLHFAIAGTLTDGAGIAVTGALLDPVDAIILKVTGPDGQAGPSVTFQSLPGDGKRFVQILFGINLFGQIFKNGKIAYSPATDSVPAKFEGTLSTTLPIVGDCTLTALWDGKEGFSIRDWPFTTKEMRDLGKSIDLADVLKKVSGKSKTCPPIDLAGLLEGGFKVHFIPTGLSGGKVSFDIVIGYVISCKNPATEQFAPVFGSELSLQDLSADMPTDFATFVGVLADAVVSVAERMMQALLDDPYSLGWILLLVAGKTALDTLLAIMCRNPSPVGGDGTSNPSYPIPPIPPLPPIPPWWPKKSSNNDGNNRDGGDEQGNDAGGEEPGGNDPAPLPGAGDAAFAAAQRALQLGLSAISLADATLNLANAVLKGGSAQRLLPEGDSRKGEAANIVAQANNALADKYRLTQLQVTPELGVGDGISLHWAQLPALPAGVVRQVELRITAPFEFAIPLHSDDPGVSVTDPRIAAGITLSLELRVNVIILAPNGAVPIQIVTTGGITMPATPPPPYTVFWIFGDTPADGGICKIAKGDSHPVSNAFLGNACIAVDSVRRKLWAGDNCLSIMNFDGSGYSTPLPTNIAPTPLGSPSGLFGLIARGSTVYYVDTGWPLMLFGYDPAKGPPWVVATQSGAIKSFAVMDYPLADGIDRRISFITATPNDPSTVTFYNVVSPSNLVPVFTIPAEFSPTSIMRGDPDTNCYYWMAAKGVVRFSKATTPPCQLVVATDGTPRPRPMSAPLGYVQSAVVPGGRLVFWDRARLTIVSVAPDGSGKQDMALAGPNVTYIDIGPPDT